MGGRAVARWRQGFAAISGSRPSSPSPARWPGPSLYPWPQRPPGLIEDAFAELAGAGSRSSTPMTTPASMSATRSIPARTFSTAPPSRCSSTPSAGTSVLHQLRPVAFRAAAARLSGVHRHLPRAHQGLPCEGRRVQSDRPAGRLFRLSALGQPRRPLPLAGRRAGRLSAPSSPSWRNTTTTAGRCSNGNAASSIPRTARREGAPLHQQPHHPRHREGVRRFRHRRRRPEEDQRMLGLG